MKQLKQSTDLLQKELAEIKRSMTELRICSSEKDAEIINLTMRLQDSRQFERENSKSTLFTNRKKEKYELKANKRHQILEMESLGR